MEAACSYNFSSNNPYRYVRETDPFKRRPVPSHPRHLTDDHSESKKHSLTQSKFQVEKCLSSTPKLPERPPPPPPPGRHPPLPPAYSSNNSKASRTAPPQIPTVEPLIPPELRGTSTGHAYAFAPDTAPLVPEEENVDALFARLQQIERYVKNLLGSRGYHTTVEPSSGGRIFETCPSWQPDPKELTFENLLAHPSEYKNCESGDDHTYRPSEKPQWSLAPLDSTIDPQNDDPPSYDDDEMHFRNSAANASPDLTERPPPTCAYCNESRAYMSWFPVAGPSGGPTDDLVCLDCYITNGLYQTPFPNSFHSRKLHKLPGSDTTIGARPENITPRPLVWRQETCQQRHDNPSNVPKITRTCIVCADDLPLERFSNVLATRGCRHENSVCRDCLQQWIETQLTTFGWEKIKCVQCQQYLQYEDVRRYATRETFNRYDELAARSVYTNEPNFVWCRNPHCGSGQIHEGGEGMPIFQCKACKRRYCIVHNTPWHEGETCVEFDIRMNGDATDLRNPDTILDLRGEAHENEQRAPKSRLRKLQKKNATSTGKSSKTSKIHASVLRSHLTGDDQTEDSDQLCRGAEAGSSKMELEERQIRQERQEYLRKKAEEQRGEESVRKISKQCPKCHWSIEKYTGCNHVST